MVPSPDETNCGHTDNHTGNKIRVTRNTQDSPHVPQAKTSDMSTIEKHIQAQGISPAAKDIILSSWRPSTQSRYASTLKKWENFCVEKQVNMFSPNAIEVINFFTAETERGVGYRALCNARSALNSVCSIPGYPDISHHPLIKRFIKGWFNLKPPRSNITYTWDVNIVLQYLNNLGENANLSFPILCKKVVTLMMLLSGTRVNSLHTFNIKLMNLTSRDCTFIPDGVIKHTRPNYKQSGIIYHSYPHNSRLCPVQTIADYQPGNSQ